jgi:hypothetical protein
MAIAPSSFDKLRMKVCRHLILSLSKDELVEG